MKRRTTLIVLAAAFALAIGGTHFVAGQEKPSGLDQSGFTGEFALIEKKDGTFTVLSHPKSGSLGGKSCLVGRTHFVSGLTDDAIFESTTQWVFLDEVRRLGEIDNSSQLDTIVDAARKLKESRESRR
jgi:hypothetical protein